MLLHPAPRTPHPFRLVLMGTPDFAVPCFRHLISTQNIIAVYSQPPRRAGRGQKLQPSPVHRLAEEHGIPVFTPASLKSPEVQEQFRAHRADAAIVAAYGLILPKPILEAYPLGCLNVHPSRLPRWRGAAPIQRTIMAGDKETALCIMQMAEGLDTGDILWEKELPLASDITAGELHNQMAALAGPAIVETLDNLRNRNIAPRPQSAEGITYAPKISKDEARLDWSRPAADMLHHIHGLSPYPGAFFEYQGEKIKILKAIAIPSLSGKEGLVLDEYLTIACGNGSIHPLLIQRPGKKPMGAEEMLRGFAIPKGTVLS